MKVKGSRRAKFARRMRRMLKKEAVMPMEFMTEFVNHSGESKKVFDNKYLMFVIQDGEKKLVKSLDPTTDWARWSHVVFRPARKIELTENPLWSNPWEGKFWCIELKNEEGSVGGEGVQVVLPNPIVTTLSPFVTASLGIPRLIPLNPDDPLIWYKELIWKMREEKERSTDCKKYFVTTKKVIKIPVPRNARDIERIKKQKSDLIMEQATKAAEAELKTIKPPTVEEVVDEVHSDSQDGSAL